jgi:ribosomal protein S18 acetylase RimI-like enzyme
MADRIRTSRDFEFEVARAVPADGDDLFALFAQIVEDGEGYPQAPPVTRAEFDEYWMAHKAAVVVARAADSLLGSYYLKPNFPGRGAHIANAGYIVARRARSQGVGEALVHHSFEVARSLGFDAMQFNLVFESNPARRLYERLGFAAVGRIPDAIDGEAAIVYWRAL